MRYRNGDFRENCTEVREYSSGTFYNDGTCWYNFEYYCDGCMQFIYLM